MTINGINGVNTQMGQMGMNQATDSYIRNIQNQIANAQKQLQELSSNEDMPLEEKMKKRQELQQQISDLNVQLRQRQMEQRREQKQAKGSSKEDLLGGKRNAGSTKEGSKSTGISEASMAALISADSSMKQAKVQGNVASGFEGMAGVIEMEIKLDASRAVNGLSANTGGKKAELTEIEQKAMDARADQMETLGEVNKSIEEAKKAEEQSDNKDTNTAYSKEKEEENVSAAGAQEKDAAGEKNQSKQPGVSVPEDTSPAQTAVTPQPKGYTSVDIRL